jgi:NitT/TauT family transport system substrate-binding protein
MTHAVARRSVLAALLLAPFATALPAIAQSKQKVTLMLNWYVTGLHAPLFVGRERGYFEKEGIDLEIQEGRGSGPTVQAVAARNVTFGFADVGTMMKLTAKGAPIKAVGVALQRSPFAVISLAERKIVQPADIKGKVVAMTAGDSPSQAWPLFLKKTGLRSSDFKTVTGDAQTKLNAVINGQADMLLGFATDQGNQIEFATKKPVSTMLFADHGVNSAGSAIVAHTDTIKDNADLVRRFMRAATLAFEEAEKSPQAAVDAVLKSVPKAGDPRSLLSGLKTAIPLFHSTDAPQQRVLRVSQKTMTDTVQSMVETGGIDAAAVDTSKYFTNEFLP